MKIPTLAKDKLMPPMTLAAALFSSPRSYTIRHENQLQHLRRELHRLDLPFDDRLLFDALAIPNGSIITALYTHVDDDGLHLRCEANNPTFGIRRQEHLLIGTDGRFLLQTDQLILDSSNQGRGIGGELFAHGLPKAQRLGVAAHELTAARGSTMFGYTYWPKLGFDAPLGMYRRAVLEAYALGYGVGLPDAVQTVQDLLTLEGGAEVWRAVGGTINLPNFSGV
jgi:GNAT superfamily N-acetyltransferase